MMATTCHTILKLFANRIILLSSLPLKILFPLNDRKILNQGVAATINEFFEVRMSLPELEWHEFIVNDRYESQSGLLLKL